MKKLVLVSFLVFLAFSNLQAQMADSTKTEPVIQKEAAKSEPAPVPIVKDSVKTVKAKPDSIDRPVVPTLPAVDTEPRIIYYQDSKPEYKDKRNDIKTLSGSMNHSGGFFGFSFRSSEFKDETAVMAGFRTGWIINRTLGIGFEGHGVIPTSKFDDITPDFGTVLLGGYGGMFMEFIVFSNQVVHITFPVSGGAGWLGYHEDWEEDNVNNGPNLNSQSGLVDQDVFWYVEPGASIEMNISRSFRMAFGLSKRITQDLDLINTKSTDFENLNFFVTLKLGKF